MSVAPLHALAPPPAQDGERLLPASPTVADLLPGGALRRGTTISVTGSTTVLLAVLAGPSQAGSWCAAAGLPALCPLAAEEAGVALCRLALVPDLGPDWPTVTAALLDALDVVVLRPPGRVRATDARRLSARARERGAVLVTTTAWDGAEVTLCAERIRWSGLGAGHGRLRGCEIDVQAGGRGAAARPRSARLQLTMAG